MKRATITEIARMANVSIKTVSRVLNGEPNVRDATRQRVRDAAKHLNYKPNFSARSLASKRSFVIVHFHDNPNADYVEKIYRGMNRVCRDKGYFAVTENLQGNYTEALKDYLTRFEIDGIILSPPLCDDPALLKYVVDEGIPFVRISARSQPKLSSFTGINDIEAMKNLTAFLLGKGHERIAFITGPSGHAAAARREKGFLQALDTAHILPTNCPILKGDFSVKTGFALTEKLLSRDTGVTAVMAANDDMAVGAVMAALKHNLDIPTDLSIVGFDGSRLGEIIWPRLTTIRQPVEAMSQKAADLLLNEISTAGLDKQEIIFDVDLVERGTT